MQQAGSAVERDHRQRPANLREQTRHRLQRLAVVIGGQVIVDQVFGFVEHQPRFFDHQLVDLHQVGGGQAAFFALRRFDAADHPGQRGLDVQQRGGNVHQHRVRWLALALSQALHHGQLVNDDLARLAKA